MIGGDSLRLRQKWRNKPRKFSDLRGFSFSVAQRLRCRFSAGGSIRPCSSPVPVYRQSLFARGAHDRESARLARRVSVPVPASAPVPREARSAVADHHRTAACMRDRRLNESTGTHGGPPRGAVAIAQRRSSNPAVRRASIESRCARHIVLVWIDCTARACSRAGTIDRRMAQYANVARDARNERNLATSIGAPRVSAIMQLMRHMAARRPNTATLPEWLRLATRAVLAIMRKAFR